MVVPQSRKQRLYGNERLFLFCGAVLLFLGLEIYIGAGSWFALLMTGFVMCVILTIRALGGLTTLFGVAMTALLAQHLMISQIVKAIVDQDPETRLDQPVLTAAAYFISGLSYLAAAHLGNRYKFRGGRPLVPPTTDADQLTRMAVAAGALAIVRLAIVGGFGQSEENFSTGGFFGILRALFVIDYLAVSCATASVVLRSDGKKFLGGLNMFTLATPLFFGIVGGHRAGIMIPLTVLIVTAFAFKFRFKLKHAVYGAVLGYVFIFILSPFALAARSEARSGNVLQDISSSASLLVDITLRQTKKEEAPTKPIKKIDPLVTATRYVNLPDEERSNLVERMSLVKATDAMVQVTLEEGPIGFTTIVPGILQLIPSFILPDKPILSTGNMLAHRSRGWIGENDYSTQITFGVVADSFSSFSWLGVMIIPGFILFCSRYIFGAIMSLNFNMNVYAIAVAFRYIMTYSEASIQGNLVLMFQTSYVILFAFFIIHKLSQLGDFSYLRPKRLPEIP